VVPRPPFQRFMFKGIKCQSGFLLSSSIYFGCVVVLESLIITDGAESTVPEFLRCMYRGVYVVEGREGEKSKSEGTSCGIV
jgi:hypothetical protein